MIAETLPWPTAAVAVAVTPGGVGALKLTMGAERYPDPTAPGVTADTKPPATVAGAVAVTLLLACGGAMVTAGEPL